MKYFNCFKSNLIKFDKISGKYFEAYKLLKIVGKEGNYFTFSSSTDSSRGGTEDKVFIKFLNKPEVLEIKLKQQFDKSIIYKLLDLEY